MPVLCNPVVLEELDKLLLIVEAYLISNLHYYLAHTLFIVKLVKEKIYILREERKGIVRKSF
jgi:hypothetical protein